MAHILITGHSRGLGSAIAEQLLDLGHHVLGLSRNPHRRLGKPHAQQFRELSVDLGQPQALSAFLSTSILEDFFRSADQALLINNAGLLTPIGPAGTLAQERILESVTVNIAAARPGKSVYCDHSSVCRSAYRAYLQRRRPQPLCRLGCLLRQQGGLGSPRTLSQSGAPRPLPRGEHCPRHH